MDKRILLRPWRRNDLRILTQLANNFNIWVNLRDRMPHPYNTRHAEAFIAYCEKQKPIHVFAIECEDEVVGSIGLELKDDVYRISAEIGYWIGEPYWGKGIATEAVRQMTDYCFREFPLIIRLYAEVFENNKASMKVLEKNGFHMEGIRQKALIKNKIILNDWVWVKFRED